MKKWAYLLHKIIEAARPLPGAQASAEILVDVTAPDPAPRPTAKALLAEELRERILDGDIAPGTPLREEELSRSHGHSRHTVRSALSQLAAERLVQFIPYRGARVADLSDAEVEDLQALRGALEAEAVRLLHERHGDAWPDEVLSLVQEGIDALADAERGGDWLDITRAHADVHRRIVAAAGSSRIADSYEQLNSETLLLLTAVRSLYASGALAEEHRGYLRDIQSGDGAVVREHLAHTSQLIREARRSRS